MLMVTEDAANVIQELAAQPDAGSLRISTAPHSDDGSEPGLQIELATEPQADDAVLEAEGGRLFPAQEALHTLDDKVLDAQVEDEGIRFSIMEIPAEGAAEE